MRYVPNLIEEKNRVLNSYFKAAPFASRSESLFSSGVSYLVGTILFLLAFTSIAHPLTTLLLVPAAFIALPITKSWIERKLIFHFTVPMRAIVGVVFLIIATPVVLHYKEADQLIAEIERNQIRLEKEEKQAIAEKEEQRKNSFEVALLKGKRFLDRKYYDSAEKVLNQARSLSIESGDLIRISELNYAIKEPRVRLLMDQGNYSSAFTLVNELIQSYGESNDLLYLRGFCESRLGQIESAVSDLRKSLELGNNKAAKLYENLNPPLHRIVGYITRCCDGSSSSAKGRGACSHHHGVCDWNEPVYETFRKY